MESAARRPPYQELEVRNYPRSQLKSKIVKLSFISVLWIVVSIITFPLSASPACRILLETLHPAHHKIAVWFAENYPSEVLSVALADGGDAFSGKFKAGDFTVHDAVRGPHPIYRMEGTSFRLVSYPANKILTALQFKEYVDSAAYRRVGSDGKEYSVPKTTPEFIRE